ncbi:MAG: NlpC/P60 family protein [Coriobacteriia bacterium]|nr:NlpC/P60 family protein [Coriobacteriia bacterium]
MRITNRTKRICAAAGCVLLSASLVCAVPVAGYATPASEKRAEAEAAYETLTQMQVKLDKASNALVDATAAKKTAQKKVKGAQKKIDKAQKKIEVLQGHLGSRARTMYRSGNTTILDVLFSSTSFQEFATIWGILDQLNQKDAAMVQKTKDLKAEVVKQKKVLDEQEAEAEKQETKCKLAKEEAAKTVDEMTSTYNALDAEAKRLLKEEQEARSRADAEAARRAIEQAQQGSQEEQGDQGEESGSQDTPQESEQPEQQAPESSEPSGGGNQSAVDRAYSMLGRPYQYGAGGTSSFDCSGLVGWAITGSTGHALGSTGTMMGFNRVTNPQPGDICVNDHHCGIYIGGGQMIHAPQTGDVVSISGVHGDMIYVRP